MPRYPLRGDVFVNNGCQSHCREQASSFLHVPRNTTIHYSRPECDVSARSNTPTLVRNVAHMGRHRKGGGYLTCVICRGNNKALPDAQASPLSATSLSLTAAVLGAIQPSLSFSIGPVLEPAQPAKPFKSVHTSARASF